MTVAMNDSSAPSSWELSERLYKKNIELETGLRKSAQSRSRVPSDPNTWLQIRENYEAIILQDHDFAQKRGVELALWQLHYRKIEEFRSHINAAKSAGSVVSQGGKSVPQPDRIKKIRSVFKSFLSESTGFYHDLILKISTKYGLPLGFLSEAPESQIVSTKDEKKSAEIKKGLMSCHRCLIYLGDLARYKTSYGEGDASNHDYTAASCYYIQAASLCPSSGNPHHQLAILSSYSGDDLVTIYRYFRSLAVEIPFSTARDNLIIAFEKNRQTCSQLPKPTAVKVIPTRSNGRARGKLDARISSKDTKGKESPKKECELDIHDVLKAFNTRFVRINGILFTRTSLETFGEILSSVINGLLELLSSGHEEVFNFGNDTADNGLIIVRLIAMLIFTVHNVNRETEGQSYAEILQRAVLLQNAFTAAYEFCGHVVKRCTQLRNAESSFLLPAILVFVEWLASYPDFATGSNVEEIQSNARSFFWNQCVSLMNKLLLSGLVSFDGDEDEACFSDMSCYDEGETGNRLALWEDFELRGFLPLVPAQIILDFSRKHSAESDGNKERKSRLERIFAAWRALMNVVQVDQKVIYFDARDRKFIIGIKSPLDNDHVHSGLPDEPKSNDQVRLVESTDNHGISNLSMVDHAISSRPKPELYMDGEDDEEEIVFKPTIAERYPNPNVTMLTACESNQPAVTLTNVVGSSYGTTVSTIAERYTVSNTPMLTAYDSNQRAVTFSKGDGSSYCTTVSTVAGRYPNANVPVLNAYESNQPAVTFTNNDGPSYGMTISAAVTNMHMPGVFHATSLHATEPNIHQQPLQHMQMNTSKWPMEQETAVLSTEFNKFNVNGNGLLARHGFPTGLSGLQSAAGQTILSGKASYGSPNMLSGQTNGSVPAFPSALDSMMSLGMASDGLSMKPPIAVQNTARRSPVSRPVRHVGPPPGFSVPSKQVGNSTMGFAATSEQVPQELLDLSWLDDYNPSSTESLGMESSTDQAGHGYTHVSAGNSNVFIGLQSSPFPGKQVPSLQTPVINEQWRDFQLFEHPNAYRGPVQQTNIIPPAIPKQHQVQSPWSGR